MGSDWQKKQSRKKFAPYRHRVARKEILEKLQA